MPTPTPGFRTIVDILRWRALQEPDQRAYTFLRDGVAEDGSWTYGEVDRQARAIASLLRESARPGDRVLLLYPPGLEFIPGFFGCLYAGLIAIPAYPPRPNKDNFRIEAIARDATPSVALTTSDLLPKIRPQLQEGLAFLSNWLTTDALPPGLDQDWKEDSVGASDLAYLQYTSGSTATPKGVMVGHDNLLHNLRDLDQGWEHTRESVMITWLPTFHDMGLVYGVLEPIFRGFPCFFMPPTSFLQRPIRWLRAISDHKGTHSAAPNFAYELCARAIRPTECANLDLSSWKAAVNGAEPVRQETLEKFTRLFAPYGFRPEMFCPGYGLAEATLKVSAVRSMETPVLCAVEAVALEQNEVRVLPERDGDASGRQRILVGCGRSSPETRVVIVEPGTATPCAPGQVGELWVSSPSVTQGYWNRPDESARTFRARLNGGGDANLEATFLRTGDLGFLQDGQVYVTGRLKDVIIIRGKNHYPEDIERTAERCHPMLRPGCCAAFSIEAGNEERLVVMQEVERTYRNGDPEELVETVRQAVADVHELQVYRVVLLSPGGILKTSSGKVQRQACKARYLEGTAALWETPRDLSPILKGPNHE